MPWLKSERHLVGPLGLEPFGAAGGMHWPLALAITLPSSAVDRMKNGPAPSWLWSPACTCRHPMRTTKSTLSTFAVQYVPFTLAHASMQLLPHGAAQEGMRGRFDQRTTHLIQQCGARLKRKQYIRHGWGACDCASCFNGQSPGQLPSRHLPRLYERVWESPLEILPCTARCAQIPAISRHAHAHLHQPSVLGGPWHSPRPPCFTVARRQ